MHGQSHIKLTPLIFDTKTIKQICQRVTNLLKTYLYPTIYHSSLRPMHQKMDNI